MSLAQVASNAPAPRYPANLPDLSGRHPREIMAWAVETFGHRLMMTTAFGYSGMALMHMLKDIDNSIPVYFIDTGYHFAETIQFRDFCRDQLGFKIIDLNPEQSRADFEAAHGANIMKRDPGFCCARNKVAPLKNLLAGGRFDAWVAALRRDQAHTRANTAILEPQPTGMLKIHPLVEWSKVEVWRYLREHAVPTHPLHDEGYMSIGCAPCTRQVREGEHERDGRWSGQGKTECGIHLIGRDGEGI